jgi:hypothetical protein
MGSGDEFDFKNGSISTPKLLFTQPLGRNPLFASNDRRASMQCFTAVVGYVIAKKHGIATFGNYFKLYIRENGATTFFGFTQIHDDGGNPIASPVNECRCKWIIRLYVIMVWFEFCSYTVLQYLQTLSIFYGPVNKLGQAALNSSDYIVFFTLKAHAVAGAFIADQDITSLIFNDFRLAHSRLCKANQHVALIS